MNEAQAIVFLHPGEKDVDGIHHQKVLLRALTGIDIHFH